MEEIQKRQGVSGLKKHNLKVVNIVFMLYCLVAAGAFGIEEMIPNSGPGLTLIMLAVFPVIWSLPISNQCAELSSVLPYEGGVYAWTKEALGEFWGFQVGWWETISIYVSVGSYVVLIANYMGQLCSMTETQSYLLKLGIILIFTIINLMGIKEVSKASTFFSVIILIAFVAVTIVGLINWNYNPMTPLIPEGQSLFESISGGIAICVWMYCGYECISNVAGEIENPQVVPKGLLIAMPLIALSYVLPTIAGLASVGQWESWATDGAGLGYADVLTNFAGPAFGLIFLVVAIISQCAIFNTYLAAGSRGFFVLADDNLSPEILVKTSRKSGVPYVGIISLAVVTATLARFEFRTLVMIGVVFTLAIYITLSFATLILRKKIPVDLRAGKYIIPGGKTGLYLTCALPFIIAVIALMINGTDYFVIGLIATATGPVFYVVFKLIYGGVYKTDPQNYPINPKTRLAKGDSKRLSLYCFITGIFAILGARFLVWYESDWGTEYYLETYGEGFFSNFNGMLQCLQYSGAGILVIAAILWIWAKKVED